MEVIMDLKKLFGAAEAGVLSYEQFESAVKQAGIKLVDLNEGNYVSKQKHEDELTTKNKTIDDLNTTIASRDTDLADLQKKLEEAGTDAQKLADLSTQFTSLQGKYETDVKNYKDQLKKQAYEFAVKDFANGKKFTSKAAKRDFIQSMIAKELKMEKDSILGADDFVTAYSQENEDAFVVENPNPKPSEDPKPTFVNPTPGSNPAPSDSNKFVDAFSFTGVRAKN